MNLWHDWWGTTLVAGVSALFAANAFRVGRDSYRWHLYLTLGNFGISLAAFLGNTEGPWPSVVTVLYCLAITVGAFFLTIGVLTVFRSPKRVKCFRCEFIGWPDETEEPATSIDQRSLNEFRRMHWEHQKATSKEAK